MSDEMFRALELLCARQKVFLEDYPEPHLYFKFRDLGWAKQVTDAPRAHFALTPDGLEAFREEKQRREHRANEEAEKNLRDERNDKHWRKDARRSWVQWTVTTILTILSFFAGAIVEVFTGFMQWVWFH